MQKTNRGLFNCRNIECAKSISPSNSSSNFEKPALSVIYSVKKGIIKSSASVMEIGSGNLRNSFYILKCFPNIGLYAYELKSTIEKYQKNYIKFVKLGGEIIKSLQNKQKYDVIMCTFVLETICPLTRRERLLKKIYSLLKNNGVLIASFRGYTGVRGSRYKLCPLKEGFLSPLKTFVKPYSIIEVKNLMKKTGFINLTLIQKYKVNKPKNIHIVAMKRGNYGEIIS